MRARIPLIAVVLGLMALGGVLLLGFRGGFGSIARCGSDQAEVCISVVGTPMFGWLIWGLFLVALLIPLLLQMGQWRRSAQANSDETVTNERAEP
jgi:hypothetical protein